MEAERGVTADRGSCSAGTEVLSDPSVCSLRFLGLRRVWLDRTLSIALVALVALSRLAALGAAPWEQDEAYFGCAVIEIDVSNNHPHPPWFPLWIAMGKLLNAPSSDPLRGLQLLSMGLSILLIFPMISLLAQFLPRLLAVLAALVYLTTPAGWMLSATALTGGAATALMVGAFAILMKIHSRPPSAAALGSGMFALCILIRPQLGLVAVVTLFLLYLLKKDRATRLALVLPCVVICGFGMAWFALETGGLSPLWASLQDHWRIHAGALDQTDLSFSHSGFAKAFANESIAFGWLIMAVFGIFSLLRDPKHKVVTRTLVLGAVIPLVLVIYALSDPTHTRYFVPLLAVLAGFMVRGLIIVSGRLAPMILLCLILFNVALVLPRLGEFRNELPPACEAMRFALNEAWKSGAVVVIDNSLVAFAQYEQARSYRPVTILRDSQIATGETPPPPREFTIAVIGHKKLDDIEFDQWRRRFVCTNDLMRRINKDRYLDVTVSIGAGLRFQ